MSYELKRIEKMAVLSIVLAVEHVLPIRLASKLILGSEATFRRRPRDIFARTLTAGSLTVDSGVSPKIDMRRH
jgi:hypothetical protein